MICGTMTKINVDGFVSDTWLRGRVMADDMWYNDPNKHIIDNCLSRLRSNLNL